MKNKYIILLALIISISIVANIVLHEVGHFVVAGSLGLSPELHLESPVNLTADNQVVTTLNFAYVSYGNMFPETTWRDALIAAGGPLSNAMLALFAAGIYTFLPRKNRIISYALLAFVLISAVSTVVNLIPIEPSDGSIIFGYLMS